MPTMRALNELSEERMEVCRGCNRFDAVLVRCRKCGCFLAAKTRFPGARCPVGKWNRDDIRMRDEQIRLRDERERKSALAGSINHGAEAGQQVEVPS